MPNIVIQINDFQVAQTTSSNGTTVFKPTNSHVQVGDLIHYAVSNNGVLSNTTQVGQITGFTQSGYINVNADASVLPIPDNPFILFSKPIKINESSVKGYYADITLENHSNKRAELFAISSEVVPSSK